MIFYHFLSWPVPLAARTDPTVTRVGVTGLGLQLPHCARCEQTVNKVCALSPLLLLSRRQPRDRFSPRCTPTMLLCKRRTPECLGSKLPVRPWLLFRWGNTRLSLPLFSSPHHSPPRSLLSDLIGFWFFDWEVRYDYIRAGVSRSNKN